MYISCVIFPAARIRHFYAPAYDFGTKCLNPKTFAGYYCHTHNLDGTVTMTVDSSTYMCAQPDTKSNLFPNRNRTTKHHAVVRIHLNIVTCPDEFIPENVVAPSVPSFGCNCHTATLDVLWCHRRGTFVGKFSGWGRSSQLNCRSDTDNDIVLSKPVERRKPPPPH